jgi:hypothetical protein
MRPDIHIENHILGRKLPRWNGLSEKEKLRLLDTARYRTSTRRGNGRQVAILVVTVLLLAMPLLVLPALLVESQIMRSIGIFFMVVAVLLVGSVHRCYQLLPELEQLIKELPPDAP